jgi:cholera toxin transcriptional activator
VQTLFVLLQFMYMGFYVGALANLAEIEDLFSPLPKAAQALNLLIVTAAILIPVRAFVLSAVLFHAPGVRENSSTVVLVVIRIGRNRNRGTG